MYTHTHSCVLAYIQTYVHTHTHTHAALTEEQEGVSQNFVRLFYITQAGIAHLSRSMVNLPNVKTERIRCGYRERRRGERQRTHTTASFATASCEMLLCTMERCWGLPPNPKASARLRPHQLAIFLLPFILGFVTA